MAEVHTSILVDKSGNQTIIHNPGQHPLAPGAGQPVVAATKTVGNPNGAVHGQVAGTSVIVHNPA